MEKSKTHICFAQLYGKDVELLKDPSSRDIYYAPKRNSVGGGIRSGCRFLATSERLAREYVTVNGGEIYA